MIGSSSPSKSNKSSSGHKPKKNAVKKQNDFNDHSDSIDLNSKESRSQVHELRHELSQRFDFINKEISKLDSSKEMYQNLRQVKDELLRQKTELDVKLTFSKTDTVKDLELQFDTNSLELRNKDTELTKRQEELEKIRSEREKQAKKFESERQNKDNELHLNSKLKDTQIKETLDKIREAQIKLEEVIKSSCKNRSSIVDKLDDVQRQVEHAKEPKFFPDALRQAERENKALLERLGSFQNLTEKIGQIEEDNDKLERKISELNAHSVINETMKGERDSMIGKIHELNEKQNEFFIDNIEKLKRLQEVEVKISSKNILIPLLKDKLNEGAQKAIDDTLDLEKDIETIDKGTDRMIVKVDDLKNKVDKSIFKDALDRIHDRVRKLNGENKANESSKDNLKDVTKDHRLRTNELDLFRVTSDQVSSHNDKMVKIKSSLKVSTNLKDDHIKEYERLINDLGDLKADIQADYEGQIKAIQKRDEGWVSDTTGNLDGAKETITQLDGQAEDDNPLLDDFLKDLREVKNRLTELKATNGINKTEMDDLSNRDMGDEDYLNFLIKLSKDQKETDRKIEDTKNESDALLKHLNKLKKDLEESDRTSKSEILNKCRNEINQRLKNLSDLNDKVYKLEENENKYYTDAEVAQQTVDKSIVEYEKIVSIDRKNGSSKKARQDKNEIEDELKSIKKLLDQSDISNVSMRDVLTIQQRTEQVSESFNTLTEFVDEKLGKVDEDHSWLIEFLRSLRDKIKTKTDHFEKDISGIMKNLKRFLTPTEKVKDSIQRPQYLKELLESTYLAKDEPEYALYTEFCELVNANLSK